MKKNPFCVPDIKALLQGAVVKGFQSSESLAFGETLLLGRSAGRSSPEPGAVFI